MTSRIRHITIDCHDPYELSRFWSGALGYIDHPDNPNAPDDPEAAQEFRRLRITMTHSRRTVAEPG